MLLTPTIISCSSVAAKNENNKPETPNLNQPVLRGVEIFPQDNNYQYTVNDSILIKSSIKGENLYDQQVDYKWYIQKEGYSIFEPIGNNSSNLTLRATSDLNNATFKVEASLKTKVCSSNLITIGVRDNETPNPPVIPNNPIIRNVTISTNKTNYNENENISITSNVVGDYLEEASISYQWYVKKNSGNFEILFGQNNKNLNINATSEYNDAIFKLKVIVNNKSLDSNTINITVNNSSTPPLPEPPIEEVDFSIITSSNKVNIGSGITFNAIFKNGISESKIDWYIQKNSGNWLKIKSEVNDTLSFIITDNTFDNAKIKAITTINGKEVNSNEITIFISDEYVPPSSPSYETPGILTPPNITSWSIQTRAFPYDVKKTLVNFIKINGKPVNVEKVNLYGDTFTVFFDEKKDFNVEIELNTNYKDYGVNMGFENPTVSFYKTTYNSGMKVVDDGNFNKVINMQPLSIKQPTHFVQITGKVQEQGYQAKDFNINIKFRNTFINNMVEGEDYFKFGNDFIVNPYTQNEAIINKYGNVPLPIVRNGQFVDPKAEVSKDDLFRMFHLIISQRWRPIMSFGSRKIWSEYFVDTFVEWLVKNWKYYPELNFNNPKLFFTTNFPNWFFDQYRINSIITDPTDGADLTFYGYETMVNNEYDKTYNESKGLKISQFLKQHYEAKDIYMTEITNFNIADRMSYSSEDQDKFFEGVSLFFTNYIKPGMSDMDKVFATYMFVSDWLRYQGNASHDQYGFWSNHVGVCANYGGISAYLLNLLGVPAIPVVTGDLGDNPVRMLHMNTWIYLDAHGDGNKKWYMQDSTWADITWGEGSTWPSMKFRGKGDNDQNNLRLMLTDVYKKQYGDYEYDTANNNAGLEYIIYHNNFFNFFGAQWFRPYIQNEVSFGEYSLKQKSWMINQYDNNLLCKPTFHNGYWYFFTKDERFVRTKINTLEYEDLTKNIPKWVMDELTKKSYGSITMAQIGKYVLLSRPVTVRYDTNFGKDDDKWFIIHNLEDTNWQQAKLLKFNPEMLVDFSTKSIAIKKTGLLTYFFDENKMLNLELQGPGPDTNSNNWKESKIFKFDIFKMFSKELAGLDIGKLNTTTKFDQQNNIIQEGDDKIAFDYYTAKGGAIGILPDKDSNITSEQKQAYITKLKNIFQNQTLTANEKAIQMKKAFDDLVKSSYKTDISNTIIKRLNNDLYQLETKYFNESYGILFDINDGFESLETLGSEDVMGSVRYNIWHSPTKDGEYELIAKDLYEPRIIKDYYKNNKSPTGYYYVEYYALNNPNVKKYSQNFKVEVEKSMFNTLPLVPDFEIWKFDPDVGSYWKFHSTSSNYSKFNTQWSHVPYQLKMEWKDVQFYPNAYSQLNITLNHVKKDRTIEKETIATITSQYQSIDWSKNLGLINDQNAGAYFIDFEYVAIDGNKYNLYSKIYYMLEYDDIVNDNFIDYKNISDIIVELAKS